MPHETYRSIIENIACKKSATVTVFADFCKMSACALAVGKRETEYLEVAQRYTRDELSDISRALALLVQEMEHKPFQDVLGSFYMECAAHSSKQARGEFFTPPEVSELMARMLFNVEKAKAEKKPITVNEPACGSGGMVLAIAKQMAPDSVDLLRVTAQDINPVAVDMAYINLTLWGIPARVILGDTIRGAVTNQWRNVHWFRVGEEDRQLANRLAKVVDGVDGSKPPIQLAEIREAKESKGQQLFEF